MTVQGGTFGTASGDVTISANSVLDAQGIVDGTLHAADTLAERCGIAWPGTKQ